MDTSEFRNVGHHVVDLLADYLERIEQRPVFPNVEPAVLNRLSRLRSTSRKSVSSLTASAMNQRIRPCQLGVAFRNRPESFELMDRIFPLV